jgi:hypothetical protein
MAGGYNRTTAIVDNSGVAYFTQTRTGNAITTGTPSPYTQNSNIRYIQTGTDILRRKANPFPLFFAPATADKSLYDWSSINYTAANYGEDTAQTFRLEGEQILLNRGSHLLATRAGWFRQDFVRESNGFIDNTDTVLYVDVNSKLLDGRANPNFLRPYIEAAGPFTNRNPELRDTVNGDLAYQFTPNKLPRWLNWIGTQRLGAHLERNRIDTEAYTYGQWIADDHAWTNRANRVAVPRSPSATTSVTTRVKISTTPPPPARTSTARIRLPGSTTSPDSGSTNPPASRTSPARPPPVPVKSSARSASPPRVSSSRIA